MINQGTQKLLAEEKWLERMALSLVRDAEDAKDVAQETILAALESPDRPEGRSLRGWLGRVATNVVRMEHRGGTRRTLREEAVGHIGEDPPKSSARLLHERQAADSVARAVQRLGEPMRSSVLLRFVDEMTIAEVAAIQGVAVGTADSRIREGLRQLRADLDTESGGDSRPWLMALCPTVGISETQAATAAVTGGVYMTKIALLLAALTAVGVLFMTQRGAASDPSKREAAHEAAAAAAPAPATSQEGTTTQRATAQKFTNAKTPIAAPPSDMPPAPTYPNPSFAFQVAEADKVAYAELRSAVELSKISLTIGCFGQYVERNPGPRIRSESVFIDTTVDYDPTGGTIATHTDFGASIGSDLDEEFKTCLTEKTHGSEFFETDSEVEPGHVRIAMEYPAGTP